MTSILIVDDDHLIRRLVRDALEYYGYNVSEAKNGEEALDVFIQTAFDLVLLDIDMGDGIDGFETCHKIRTDLYGAWVPIIFLTAMEGEKNLLKGMREGGNDYIGKPFSPMDLVSRVEEQLHRFRHNYQILVKLGERQFNIGSTIRGKEEKYKITRRIATGGMGVVFEGYRLSDNLKVAIKTLNSHSLKNRMDIRRFLHEAYAMQQLRHRNIARGIELVRTGDNLFLVMEYIEGESLYESLKNGGRMDPYVAVNIICQISSGLEYFHGRELVHRDVKPANIIVDQDQHSVLVDMGLLIKRDYRYTTAGVVLGSLPFLSPEQITGGDIDIRSDIYSLGITFFYAVTGTIPFVKDSITSQSIIDAKWRQSPPNPLSLCPDLDEGIARIIVKMTQKRPHHRYQTPVEVIRDLVRVSSDSRHYSLAAHGDE